MTAIQYCRQPVSYLTDKNTVITNRLPIHETTLHIIGFGPASLWGRIPFRIGPTPFRLDRKSAPAGGIPRIATGLPANSRRDVQRKTVLPTEDIAIQCFHRAVPIQMNDTSRRYPLRAGDSPDAQKQTDPWQPGPGPFPGGRSRRTESGASRR